jgi:hypothetical protein
MAIPTLPSLVCSLFAPSLAGPRQSNARPSPTIVDKEPTPAALVNAAAINHEHDFRPVNAGEPHSDRVTVAEPRLFDFFERSDQRFLIEARSHRTIYRASGHKLRRRTMISKLKITVIAAVAALSIAVPTAAMAQSAWSTGTAQNRAAAGYQVPNNY